MAYILHLVPNAHLDPVWLWDWREGLNEGINTVRTVLDLMDEFPELTFIRGEARIYQHIAQFDPATFARIRRQVENGRWDIVGGTVVQMDTNLPCTEVISKQFELGTKYFRKTFGKEVTVAWAADSFGHSGGLPDILAAHGIKSIAFTRPMQPQLPLNNSVFIWRGTGGAELLAYRPKHSWYGAERGEMPARLDRMVHEATEHGLSNVACFMGLGNHGGGPTRRQIRDVLEWRDAHPEVTIKFSGLHPLFESLRAEFAAKPAGALETITGELNFTLRGCYSSAARFKYAYRLAEAQLLRAEKTIRLTGDKDEASLAEAWDGLLFNSFHDILPGSSIERAMNEQEQWIGGVIHGARRAEFNAISTLQARMNTSRTEAPIGDMPAAATLLVLNPHEVPFDGYVEFEASLDYRPIFSYDGRSAALPVRLIDGSGRSVAFQRMPSQHFFMESTPWIVRAIARVELPARGWAVYDLAYVEGVTPVASEAAARTANDHTITNGPLTVSAVAGANGIDIQYNAKPLLNGDGLGFATFADSQGTWGDMLENVIHHTEELENWTIRTVRVIEDGPQRATLQVTLAGARSEITLFLSVSHGRNVVDVSARLFWNERGPRLKMLLPAGERATFDIPGGQITRGPSGEVPGGRWVIIHSPRGDVGFASNALYNFDSSDGVTRATIVRSACFANHTLPTDADSRQLPVQDRGEHVFKFLLTPDAARIKRDAIFLEQPLIVQTVPPHVGELGRQGALDG